MLVPIAALGVLLGVGASESLGAVTWSGTWEAQLVPPQPRAISVMTLSQTGTALSGRYLWSPPGGRIFDANVTVVTGVVKGPRLSAQGKWDDGSGAGPGTFTWTMDQTLQQFSGSYTTAAGTTRQWNGVCISGPCKSNAPDPAPPETNWRWASDAWRNVGPGTAIRVRSGRHVYRLYKVRFRARGNFDAFGRRARVLRASQIGLQFIYKRVGARRFRTYRINLHKFSGENYIKSGTAETLITAARTTSRARGCQAWTRMWFTERTRGSDRAVIRFLARCRIPGGRVTRIVFRDTKNGRARVAIVPR